MISFTGRRESYRHASMFQIYKPNSNKVECYQKTMVVPIT